MEIKDLTTVFELGMKVIKEEYKQMPDTCDECGGKMTFSRQALIREPVPGDRLTYACEDCDTEVTKFFEFPEEYARLFRGDK